MQKQVKKLYEAPDLTVVSFQVEKGFSVSDPFLAFTLGGWDGDNRHNAETPFFEDYIEENDNGDYFHW